MKRGDLVICDVKEKLNYVTWFWDYVEVSGVILQVKKSTRGSNMYLVKLDDEQQLYFYEGHIRLDKVRIRQNIFDQLGI